MKKGLLALMIGVIGIGIWGISTAHDCNLFNEVSVIDWKATPYPAILKDDPILNVVPEEALHRALLNLQAHCCATNKSDRAGKGCQSSSSDWKNRTNYPQSAFLFDHIVDVLMRRLANDRSYPGLPVDKKANEWHSKVDGLVSSVDGVLPLQFQTEYDTYWQLQSNYLLPEYEYSSSVKYPDLIRQLENINKLNKYDQWTIRTSYFNVCSVAVYLNMILAPNNANTPLQTARRECKKMTSAMLSKENQYLKSMIVYKSDQLVNDSLQLYSNLYNGERMNRFKMTLHKLSTEWLGVARQVPMLVPMCSY